LWKKNKSFFLPRPNPLSSRVLSPFFYTVTPQKMQTFKDHCGSFYESMAHLYKIKQAALDFYHSKWDKRLQALAANVVISNPLMLPLTTA